MSKEQLFLVVSILLGMILVMLILLLICLRQLNKNRTVLNEIAKIKKDIASRQNYLDPSEEPTDIAARLDEIQQQLDSLSAKQKKCFDRVQIVRYIADGEQNVRSSYSVGLTNEDRDGLVITGLMYRNGMNLYVKKIDEGVCDYTLSEEEKEAIGRNKVAEVRK